MKNTYITYIGATITLQYQPLISMYVVHMYILTTIKDTFY